MFKHALAPYMFRAVHGVEVFSVGLVTQFSSGTCENAEVMLATFMYVLLDVRQNPTDEQILHLLHVACSTDVH